MIKSTIAGFAQAHQEFQGKVKEMISRSKLPPAITWQGGYCSECCEFSDIDNEECPICLAYEVKERLNASPQAKEILG